MNSHRRSVNLRFNLLAVFILFLGCKKGFLRTSFSTYFNFDKSAKYLDQNLKEGYVQKISDTVTEFGEMQSYLWLDETKTIKKEGDFIYEIKEIKASVPELMKIKSFLIPLIPLYPVEGEKVNIKNKGIYIFGSDTLKYEFRRKIEISKNKEDYEIFIYDYELKEIYGKKEENYDTFYYFLQRFDVPLIIKKGGNEWRREN